MGGGVTVNLDDPQTYLSLDGFGMGEHIRAWPTQCRSAWELAQQTSLPPDYAGVGKIVILGMGGSAIGGDLAGSLVEGECKCPVFVCRDYDLPLFVDQETLVVASSYSGNTEETISAFEQALRRGAKIVAITTGGKLREMAEASQVPVVTYQYEAQPRAALGYSLITILGLWQRLGLIGDKSEDLSDAMKVMARLWESLSPANPLRQNPAKRLACRIRGCIPVVYGGGILSSAARRWKGQINENGKGWAFYESFPELDHNSVAGYSFPEQLIDKIFVIFLHSTLLHGRTQIRYKITQELLTGAGISYEVLEAQGRSPLSHLLSTVLLGDMVSYYLAMLNGVDPTPIAAIAYLKERLAEIE